MSTEQCTDKELCASCFSGKGACENWPPEAKARVAYLESQCTAEKVAQFAATYIEDCEYLPTGEDLYEAILNHFGIEPMERAA